LVACPDRAVKGLDQPPEDPLRIQLGLDKTPPLQGLAFAVFLNDPDGPPKCFGDLVGRPLGQVAEKGVEGLLGQEHQIHCRPGVKASWPAAMKSGTISRPLTWIFPRRSGF
jgi:hypothetical protein